MQLRVEFLNKKFHFGFKHFFPPPGVELYELLCKRSSCRIEKRASCCSSFFAMEMIGNVHLFNSGILTFGCKTYSISLFWEDRVLKLVLKQASCIWSMKIFTFALIYNIVNNLFNGSIWWGSLNEKARRSSEY